MCSPAEWLPAGALNFHAAGRRGRRIRPSKGKWVAGFLIASSMKIFFTQKELAGELNRSRQFVAAMQKLGLQFPCTMDDVIGLLNKFPHPAYVVYKKKKGRK